MLPDYIRENLEACDKEQLIWIIEQYWYKDFNISEICVDESKYHYSSAMAVDKIRDELRSIDFQDLIFSSSKRISVPGATSVAK